MQVRGSITDSAGCAHIPAANWTTDGEYHWKVCTVQSCGSVIKSTKAKHVSTGANVATWQKRAVCDVCGVAYGDIAQDGIVLFEDNFNYTSVADALAHNWTGNKDTNIGGITFADG